MCTTCGCAAGNVQIEGEHHHHHEHEHHAHHHPHHQHENHEHGVHHHHYYGTVHIHYHVTSENEVITHSHSHNHDDAGFKPQAQGDDLHFGQGPAHSHAPGMSQTRMVQIEQDILAKNDSIAERNRAFLRQRGIRSFNLVSSPGSGKTTLLTETLNRMDKERCTVIEGDQQTTNDAERIRATGVKAIQVNTGKGCHLDAQMVSDAIARLTPAKDSILFIENVGNLVCPAAFDLGESARVAILSVTEGEDKPLKYPDIFANAELMIITKTDLLPHLDFDLDTCIANAKRVSPNIKHLLVSAKSGEGMQDWLNWLEND